MPDIIVDMAEDDAMNIGLCYENISPARGGCETYLADFTRRLVTDGHEVHVYAAKWDEALMPCGLRMHRIESAGGPRFLRPWRFADACQAAMSRAGHEVTLGFDKTWGQDILFPQGGLHLASREHNLRKFRSPVVRALAAWGKRLDPAARSFAQLERKQYLPPASPTIIVNSEMVRGHFQRFYGIDAGRIHVIHSAVDPKRFEVGNRTAVRAQIRAKWGLTDDEPVALFVAMNYRLKGLEPLLRSLVHLPAASTLKVAVVGNPRFQRFARLATKLGVSHRVVFHGYCGDSKQVYFASDFLVHPTFYDPCSLVALESLACGLPVITSRFNGASELLTPGVDSELIDNPHDYSALSAALARFEDASLRRSASAAALTAANRWTFDKHCRKMFEVMSSVASRRAAA